MVGAGEGTDAHLLRACYFKVQGWQRWLGDGLWWPSVAVYTVNRPQGRGDHRRGNSAERLMLGARVRVPPGLDYVSCLAAAL